MTPYSFAPLFLKGRILMVALYKTSGAFIRNTLVFAPSFLFVSLLVPGVP